MIRWLSRLLVITALVLFAAFVFFISPSGLNVSLHYIQKQFPGKLNYTGASGTIFGPLHFNHLEYHSAEFEVEADDLRIEWHLPMLLLRQLEFTHLSAKSIKLRNYRYHGTRHALNLSPKKLKLALGISIESGHIDEISWESPQYPFVQLTQVNAKQFHLKTNDISGQLRFKLKAPYDVDNILKLDGKLTNYHFLWTLTKQHEQLKLSGHGTRGMAYVFLNRNHVFGGSLHGKIQLSWYPYFTWNTRIQLAHLDLKRFDPRLPNLTNAIFRSVGIWQETIPRFNCDISLENPGNHFSMMGVYSNAWNIRWDANLKRLDQLFPNGKGQLNSTGRIFGDKSKPIITATLHGEHFRLLDYRAKLLQLDALVDFTQSQDSHMTLTANHLHSPLLTAKQLELSSQANSNFSRINTSLHLDNKIVHQLKLLFSLSGQTQPQDQWQGALTQFSLSSDEIAHWTLQHPSQLTLGKQLSKLDTVELKSTRGTIFLSANSDKSNWHVQSHGALNSLNSLSRLLSKYLSIKSAAQYQVTINGQRDRIDHVDADFKADAGRIEYTRHFESVVIPFNTMTIHTNSVKNSLIMDLNARGTSQNTPTNRSPDYLRVHLQLNQLLQQFFEPKEHPIDGHLDLRFSKLKLLQFFIPEISEPNGIVTGHLDFNGSLENPSATGKINLNNGQVDIPSLKVQLDDVNLNLTAKNQRADYTINAKSAGVPLRAEGETDFSDDDIKSKIHIRGNNILIVNTAEYVIYANANIWLNMHGQESTLSGDIFIPKAIIRPADFSTTVSLPDDVVIIRNRKAIEKSPWLWFFDLNISLGDDIVIDSYGLKAKLAGSAQLTNSREKPNVIATGQLQLVDASYTTQGKKLTIEPNSYINYSHDPLKNPHLNIRMSRIVTVLLSSDMSPVGPTEATVGVEIRGTVKRPRVTMFSSPMTLSQADIISYLLFNQAASGSSSGNVGVIIQAVQSLKFGGESDNSTLGSIQQSLGITELGVQQQTYIDAFGTPFGVNQSGFVLGRYITPRIYVRYTHGLVTKLDIYQLRYIINKNWAIQAETGPVEIGNGVDLLYTVSRKHFPW
jgi:autotransporter translocation and assembly factor TamB